MTFRGRRLPSSGSVALSCAVLLLVGTPASVQVPPAHTTRHGTPPARNAPARVAADRLVLRPGFTMGDTSLVLYFDLQDTGFASRHASVFDVADGTEQVSAELAATDLRACGAPRRYCHSFGAAEGWKLQAGHRYFTTITATYAGGSTVVSPPSNEDVARQVELPPAGPAAQTSACACADVLGRSSSGQQVRGFGVNTGTGAYSRTEVDLSLASFGVPFSANRWYSSTTTTPGTLGVDWTWTYDVAVKATDDGGGLSTLIDVAGRVVRITLRTDLGLIRRIDLPDGRFVQFDDDGRHLITAQVPNGRTTQYRYDSAGRLFQVIDPRGQVQLTTTYDDADSHENLDIDGNGNQDETSYDPAGDPTSRTAPEPFSYGEKTTYESGNEPMSFTDGNGHTRKAISTVRTRAFPIPCTRNFNRASTTSKVPAPRAREFRGRTRRSTRSTRDCSPGSGRPWTTSSCTMSGCGGRLRATVLRSGPPWEDPVRSRAFPGRSTSGTVRARSAGRRPEGPHLRSSGRLAFWASSRACWRNHRPAAGLTMPRSGSKCSRSATDSLHGLSIPESQALAPPVSPTPSISGARSPT